MLSRVVNPVRECAQLIKGSKPRHVPDLNATTSTHQPNGCLAVYDRLFTEVFSREGVNVATSI